ncbi:MAG: transporter [Mycobacterium sp.]|nr:transporter [Mycobacterium sp.]
MSDQSTLTAETGTRSAVAGGAPVRAGRRLTGWDPENPAQWENGGRRIAARNLVFSVFAEHVGFSVWSLWSVMVLFMTPAYGLDPGEKFLLVSVATGVGALMRLPYTYAVARFGGRNWTIVSALLLLLPTVLGLAVMTPGTSFRTFLLVAAVTGLGGGNFASSMANINSLYPERRKGWALGLNAGGGNLGVPAVQLVALTVIATAGLTAPRLVLGVYLPLIVLAALGAALFMDNLDGLRNDTGALREVLGYGHTWAMSFLYIGTFGSFIGFGFAFGLVLQTQFGRTPLEAAYVTFLGPLLGSLVRPLGGALADRYGGARVTRWTFVALAAGAGVLLAATEARSLGVFTAGFVAVFVLTGIGNGSTYKLIPAVFRARAATAVAGGASYPEEAARARRLSGALIGLAGAIGALGGLLVNLTFRAAYAPDPATGIAGSGTAAYAAFLGFYVVCALVTAVAYRHDRPLET